MLMPVFLDAGWPEQRFATAVRLLLESEAGGGLVALDDYRREAGFVSAEAQIDNASTEQILAYMDYRDRVINEDEDLRNLPYLWR